MYNTNEWYVFDEGTIDTETCNKLTNLGKDKWQPAISDIKNETTDEEREKGRLPDYKLDPQQRISDVVWCNEQWMYDIITPYMHDANKHAGWRYEINAAESAQITRYEPGGFYTWHKDGPGDHLSAYNTPQNEFIHGKVRKVSMSVMLNDNFEGGAFEFASYKAGVFETTTIPAKAGSIIIFPSYQEHRVAPITKGIRYSLVCWFLGPPFV